MRPGPCLWNTEGMPSPPHGKRGGSVGPPWLVVVAQVAVVLALIQGVLWLASLPGNWDLIVWIGMGVPLAAAIHRFNKARYGAATRPPLWDSRRR